MYIHYTHTRTHTTHLDAHTYAHTHTRTLVLPHTVWVLPHITWIRDLLQLSRRKCQRKSASRWRETWVSERGSVSTHTHTHQQCLHRCTLHTAHFTLHHYTARGTDCTKSCMQGSYVTADERTTVHLQYTSQRTARNYMVYSVVTMTTEKKNPWIILPVI